MSTTPRDIIRQYYAADAKQDTDSLVALFTEDAEVTDEGQTRRGISEIRAWRQYVRTAYQYTTDVRGIRDMGNGVHEARVRLEGDFPGGIVDLTNRFTIAGARIRRLEISP